MPRVPFAVGDKVCLFRSWQVSWPKGYEDPFSRGTVVGFDAEYIVIQWAGRTDLDLQQEAYLTALCAHCLLPLTDHATNRKCLYAPTHWKGAEP